jgi:hypothetical protein
MKEFEKDTKADLARGEDGVDEEYASENELSEGGKFLYRMEAKDGSFGFDYWGIYDEVKAKESLVSTLGDGRKVSVSFEPFGESTKIVETFELETENSLEHQEMGWQSILDNFKKYVEVLMTIIITVIILGLIFDFINGFHDTANAIAMSVSTRALSPRFAVIYAGVLNFLGAITSQAVAKSIGGKIADPSLIHNGMAIVIAALISAILWNLITWYFGIPSSSSHTLIGSVAGAVIFGSGLHSINWVGFTDIIKGLVISHF